MVDFFPLFQFIRLLLSLILLSLLIFLVQQDCVKLIHLKMNHWTLSYDLPSRFWQIEIERQWNMHNIHNSFHWDMFQINVVHPYQSLQPIDQLHRVFLRLFASLLEILNLFNLILSATLKINRLIGLFEPYVSL